MNYKIRKANLYDAQRANEFLTKLIRDEKKYDVNINENCVVISLYEKFLYNDNNCVLVAEENDEIIGYLYGYVIDSGDSYLNKVSQLEAMFVDENNRGKKVGFDLIEAFKKWSKEQNCKYIELKVCNGNETAINLYRKQGFCEVKTIMSLDLEG